MRWRRRLMFIAGGLALLGGLIVAQFVCLTGYLRYGFWTSECPSGRPVLGVEVEAHHLKRGAFGQVVVRPVAFYTPGPADTFHTESLTRGDAKVSLVVGDDVQPLEWETPLAWQGDRLTARVWLPKDLPDGDHHLRATVSTPLGDKTVDIALPVYAPAKIHVITDRPLYEPGNLVQFRAVVLGARALAPLDERPGRWKVLGPSGDVLYEEKTKAGEFGVAASDFPLDAGANIGTWRVVFVSGEDSGEASFRVEPFTLPRFLVQAAPLRPFYGIHDVPMVQGEVRYSSGAPVQAARLDLEWSYQGAWPPPNAWMTGGLPTSGATDARGQFELRLPPVPKDLQGQVTLTARISATDPVGDRVQGQVSVLLSKDAISTRAVTELGDGIVQGFNNRVYLRVTTADGRVLPHADLRITRAWDPQDPGTEAQTDADGVASLQIDPGPPVNVVIPAQPIRPPPKPPTVTRTYVRERLGAAGLSLSDQTIMDGWDPDLAACESSVNGASQEASTGLWVAASGRITVAVPSPTPLGQCVAKVLSKKTLTADRVRQVDVRYRFHADLPQVSASFDATPSMPDDLQTAFTQAAVSARSCLPQDVAGGAWPRVGVWSLGPSDRKVAVNFVADPSQDGGRTPSFAGCLERAFSAVTLPPTDTPRSPMMGWVRLNIQSRPSRRVSKPQDQVWLGYELLVSASDGDKPLGETKLRIKPGSIPPLRFRTEPILAKPGEEVILTVLRGPDFSGTLPKHLFWRHEGQSYKTELDAETRTSRFSVPSDASGWFEVEHGGAKAVVFVAPPHRLNVRLTPDKAAYRPRDTAKIAIQTSAKQIGMPAAVSLLGVDATLGQLTALPGPGAMNDLRPAATMQAPAFGSLDARALAMGHIRGPHAAAAVVAKVSKLAQVPDRDRAVSVRRSPTFEPVEALTDAFYQVWAELNDQVRTWEKEAPQDERMRPATMARLWQTALAACQKRGTPVNDAYGRPLTLGQLPDDLLALVDPRVVVVQGTRLPEDVESWIPWVRKEAR